MNHWIGFRGKIEVSQFWTKPQQESLRQLFIEGGRHSHLQHTVTQTTGIEETKLLLESEEKNIEKQSELNQKDTSSSAS